VWPSPAGARRRKLVWPEGVVIASAASYVLVTALAHRLPLV